jgi:hypothetical protein
MTRLTVGLMTAPLAVRKVSSRNPAFAATSVVGDAAQG